MYTVFESCGHSYLIEWVYCKQQRQLQRVFVLHWVRIDVNCDELGWFYRPNPTLEFVLHIFLGNCWHTFLFLYLCLSAECLSLPWVPSLCLRTSWTVCHRTTRFSTGQESLLKKIQQCCLVKCKECEEVDKSRDLSKHVTLPQGSAECGTQKRSIT